MIASVFSKSKPINFVIVAVFIALFIGGVNISASKFNYIDKTESLINLLVLLFSLFLMDFINSKNSLTQKNGYAILFFGLFATLIPEVIDNSTYIWSNLFVIFALRRLISLQSRKHVKKKLFDAAFWISVAAILNPWTALFFILVIVAVLYYSGNDVKTIMTPLVGVACVLVLKVCYNVVIYDSYFLDNDFLIVIPKDMSYFTQIKPLISIIPFIGLIIWTVASLLFSMKDRSARMKPSYVLLLIALIIGVLVSVLSMQMDGAAFIYALVPAALIVALGIELIERKELVNSVITLFLLLPIISLFF